MLITVRTYPDPSEKYDETVCTAGITDNGEWRRLYPVPLRYLDYEKQYRTWSIVRLHTQPNATDNRPESRRPVVDSLEVEGELGRWEDRRDWVAASSIFASTDEMVSAGRSIGPVAVREVKAFDVEPEEADWSPKQKARLAQERIWDDRKPLEKMPVRFRLRWVDGDGKEHRHTFRSWEVCETWRNWRDKYGEDGLDGRLREKWLGDLFGPRRDIQFFMGNLSQPKMRRIFQIVGSFTPPKGSKVATLFHS